MSIILNRVTLCIIILGLVGIAGANPCPASSSDLWDNAPTVGNINLLYDSIGTNLIRIYAQGTDANPTPGAGFKEVCVYIPNSDISGVTAIWNISGEYWSGDDKGNIAEFGGKGKSSGNNYNIPFDGDFHAVGDIEYSSVPDMGNALTLVHINDPDFCAELGANGDTCYVRPEPQLPPVPEMSPLILTSAGLIGLILLSKKYGKILK